MRSFGLKLLMGAAAITLTATGAQAGAIAANPNPISFDSGFGKIEVSGQIAGLAYYQNNATHAASGDATLYSDISNALIAVAKTEGMFQFYVQAGLYSFPTVGNAYDKANDQNSFLGPVPVAYAKLQLTDEFSVSAGKLPTLIGYELAFTPQNINIERGLLWWQEPVSSRGVQANYASGPLSIAVSWNDGYYSNIWNSFSGLISYAIDDNNTIAFDGSGTLDTTTTLGHEIYDLMYTYSADPWTIGAYGQYEHLAHSAGSEWGIGLLGSYQLTPEWSLNARAEYEWTHNAGLEYATAIPGYEKASAFSVTVTPTWQKGIFFARGELSYTNLPDYAHATVLGTTYGLGFGKTGGASDQFRAMFETGVVF